MAHVQSFSEANFSATNTDSVTLTGVAGGNALLAFTRVASGAAGEVLSVSSNVDGAFTQLTTESNGTIVLSTWLLENATVGDHTISYTTQGTGVTIRWGIAEYGDVPTSSVVDDSADAAFTTATGVTTAPVTTTGTNRTIVSIIATNNAATTIVPAGGEAERQEVDARLQIQDEAAATADDYSASWTLGATQPGVYAILALKPPATTKYLKVLAEAAAASDTAVAGRVFNGDDYIGAFTGQAFEADLESGEAALLVAVADITPDGNTLTTSDTPTVFAYNATDATSGPGDATVIEV
jgi:hypothetical protein